MKLVLLLVVVSGSLSYSSDNCHSSGQVCGNDNNTYVDACSCGKAGARVMYLGACGNQWVPQRDVRVYGNPNLSYEEVSEARQRHGWEKPGVYQKPSIFAHNYINWKFDEVLEPKYDTSSLGDGNAGHHGVNYNYNNWHWGNWNWMNDVHHAHQ